MGTFNYYSCSSCKNAYGKYIQKDYEIIFSSKPSLNGVSYLRYPRDQDAYLEDAQGVFGTPEYKRSEETQKHLEDQLRNLPDEAVVYLGLQKDVICNSCPIGKHCEATNFKRGGKIIDATQETSHLKSWQEKFLRRGFREGTNFIIIPAAATFLDYHGENLWNNIKPPAPKVFEYNALLVKMRAFRKIA